MSAKFFIYTFFIWCIIGCAHSKNELNEPEENALVFYLASDIHLGYDKGTLIVALNYPIGELVNISLQKDEIIYTLQFSQKEVLFTDSELILESNQLVIDNKNSVGKPLQLGDTIRISLKSPSLSSLKKDSVTTADLDSLQQRINKLTQLIEELDGTN
jgi:hypothetical protein